MPFNLDSFIFLAFLVVNLGAGIFFGRGIRTIKEYAIGGRNFSTLTIAATLVATWISGSAFVNDLSQSYSNGLYFIWAIMGSSICFLVIGWFFAPRLAEFLGKVSIAEAMGDLYGKNVRVISALAGCAATCGYMAGQIKVSGMLFEYAFDLPSEYGMVAGATIVAIYSSFGGIKSVTFTDVIQLFTFGTIIPTLAFFVFGSLDSIDVVLNTVQTSELFNYKEVFDFTQPKSLYYLFLFLYFMMPGFEPPIFQRISMAKSTSQVRKSFMIAGFTCLLILIIMSFIGVLVLSLKPGLEATDVIKHVIFEYSYVGLKGLTMIGIMAMVMSTIDSYVNSTSVLFIHDFCKPLGMKWIRNELMFSRITALVVTIISLKLALSGSNILQLIILGASFYAPVVTAPFIMAVFGFRTSPKAVLISMVAGISTVLFWTIILPDCDIDSVIPAMFVNITFLLGSHYILRQPGGWVGILDDAPLRELRQQRKIKFNNLKKSIVNFRLFEFLKKYTPSQEHLYISVSLFCIISIFAAMYSIPKDVHVKYEDIIGFVFPTSLILTTSLMSYPLWPNLLREKQAIVVMWNLVVFYVLVCVGFLFVIFTDFAQAQMMMFMVNLIMLAVVVRWKLALLMIIMGVLSTITLFKIYTGSDIELDGLEDLKFEVSYALLFMSAILVAFFKPQQDRQELVEAKIGLLGEQMDSIDNELRRSMKIKNEFLNNISHEVRTPITGIAGLSQSLYDSYDNLNEDQRREATRNIAQNSQRLYSLMENILDISKLASLNYTLDKKEINLSKLIRDRINICSKIYLEDKELEFIRDIEDNVVINCDEHYIQSTLDNLIINAIKYSQVGRITITLKRDTHKVRFSIKDEGVGIPKSELKNIFDPFVVSSRTYTPAGGRGIGLTLCRKAIELHGNKIWAESDGEKGSTFLFEFSL